MSLRSDLLGAVYANQSIHEATTIDEEMLAMQVANEALGDIDVLSAEVHRLSNMAYGLEGLMDVCSHIQEASAEHLCLVESATELALAGTNIGVEEVLPGLEGDLGRSIDLEAIGDVLKNVWATTKKMLKRIWFKLKTFINGVMAAIPRLRKSAIAMKEKAEACQGKAPSSQELEVGRLASVLCHKDGQTYAFISDTSEYSAYLEKYLKLSEALLETGPNKVMTIEKDLVNSVKELNVDELYSTTDSLPRSYATIKEVILDFKQKFLDPFLSLKTFPNYSQTGDDRYSTNDVVTGKHVLAGRAIVFVGSKETEDVLYEPNRSYASVRENLSTNFQVIMSVNDNKKDLPDKGTISPLTPSTCMEIADSIVSLCDLVYQFISGNAFKAQEKTKDELEDAVDKISKSIVGKTHTSSQGGIGWRTVQDIPDFYRRMTFEIQSRLASHLLLVCRAMLDVSKKSLAQYK